MSAADIIRCGHVATVSCRQLNDNPFFPGTFPASISSLRKLHFLSVALAHAVVVMVMVIVMVMMTVMNVVVVTKCM